MASISTLTDDFAFADTAKWTFGAGATVSGGRLVLDANPSYSATAISVARYDLTGSALLAELVQAANSGQQSFESFVSLDLDASNAMYWSVNSGNIVAVRTVAGSLTEIAKLPYNATAHRWFRIREAGGVVYYDTSPDGTSWVTRASWTPTYAVTSLAADLGAGYFLTETLTASATFDNVNLPPTNGRVVSPNDVSNLVARWNAADITGIADGARVPSWPGAAATPTALTQATTTSQPFYKAASIGGQPAVRFSAGSNSLSGTVAAHDQPVTYGVVLDWARQFNTTGQQQIIHNSAELYVEDANGYTAWAGNTAVKQGAPAGSDPVFLVAVFDGGQASLYLNGTLVKTGAAGPYGMGGTFYLGAHRYIVEFGLEADVAEVVVYGKALTAYERARVGTYVQDRYGIIQSDYIAPPVVADVVTDPDAGKVVVPDAPPLIQWPTPPQPAVWQMFSRDANYKVSGGLPIGSAQFVVKHLGVDTAVIETPYTEDAFARLAPGCGIIIERDGRQEFSGLIGAELGLTRGDDGTALIRAQCYGDNIHLQDRLAYPDPGSRADQQTVNDRWTGYFTASTAMHVLIDQQMGPHARAERQVPGLIMGVDPGVGELRTYETLWDPVIVALGSWSVLSGLNIGVRMTSTPDGLRYDLYLPRLVDDAIRFSADLNNLHGFTYTQKPPDVTYAIVPGQGELKNRIRRVQSSTNPLDLRWGRRIEKIFDRRDEPDASALQLEADDQVIKGTGQVSLACTLSDSAAAVYGQDWGLGDRVSVLPGMPGMPKAAIVTDIVRQIEFRVDSNGAETITPAIGGPDATTGPPSPTQAKLTEVGRRLEGLITAK